MVNSKYLNILTDKCNENIIDSHIFNYVLDDFQKHACYRITQNENVFVCAKTGVGKTVPAIYGIHHSLKNNMKVVYTTPIKSLSNQKYQELSEKFSSVGIMTGDIKFNPTAQCIIMTTEILRNILYNGNSNNGDITIDEISTVIFDEVHYINNIDRGIVWEECMILLPPRVTMILLSATIDKPEEFASWLGDLKQKPINLIIKNKRIIPLTHYYYNNDSLIEIADNDSNFKNYDILKKTYNKEHINKLLNPFVIYLQNKNLLPCLFFIFSRNNCEKYSKIITQQLITAEEAALVTNIFDNKLAKYKHLYEKTPQYNTIKSLLLKGICYHHSGVVPILKEIIEILFTQGLIKILFCTETFAVGINAPTKTAIFTKLTKFSEDKHRYIYTDEYLQMAGRAGRRGLDKTGTVIILPIEDLLEKTILQKMITGKPACVTSKFYYSYQFILKIIDNKLLDLNNFIETSLYNISTVKNINSCNYELDLLNKNIPELNSDLEILYDKFNKYTTNKEILEDTFIKIKGNQLNKIKNAQKNIENMNDFHKNYKLYIEYKNKINEKNKLLSQISYLKSFNKVEINNIIDFLLKNDYITFNESVSVWNPIDKISYMDNYNILLLNVKGIIAKNINECNEILFTELIINKYLHDLKPNEIVAILCVFIEEKEEVYLSDLDIPDICINTIKKIEQLANVYKTKEYKCDLNIKSDWNLYYSFVQIGYLWASGSSIYEIYNYGDLQDGNFIRNIIRIDNLVENMKLICDIIEDYELLHKIQNIHDLLIRDQVTTESLYIK